MELSFYPSYQSLALADQILYTIGEKVPGFRGRLGAYWYWRLPAGLLVTFRLGYRITEQRWDILHAEAVTPRAGLISAADFPFAMYGTLMESPPFIHELDGVAEWSNRLYFQMGQLIQDAVAWMDTLLAVALDPQISIPSALPALSHLEQALVTYALEELDGRFVLKALHVEFGDAISKRGLSRLAQKWESAGLLTERPRRVTIALRNLVKDTDALA